MSLANIHARAERFQSRIRWRNWIEYGAGAVVVLAFGWVAFAAGHALAQTGAALIALGTIYVCWRLHVLAHAASKQELAQAANWADFHRAELVRQRDALRGVWRWYLGPLVPGLVVFWIGVALAPSTDLPAWGQAAVGAIGIGVAALVFFAIGAANAKAAKALDEEINALDQARKG